MATEDDLLAMLDLSAPVPAAGADPAPEGDSPDEPAATVFPQDGFDAAAGLKLKAEVRPDFPAGYDRLEAGNWADFYVAGYSPDPHPHPRCVDERLRKYVTEAVAAEAFAGVRKASVLDPFLSELAAAELACGWAELKKGGNDPTDRQVMSAAGRAAGKAGEAVRQAADAAAGLGIGTGDGAGKADRKALADTFARVRKSKKLLRLFELAGRFRRLARSVQRHKAGHGADELVGVEPGGDVARCLPAELMKLDVPELELDFLRRLVERQLPCRQFRATERVARGPVVVCVDESGSMLGDRIAHAKAFALTMAWVARKQRRWCALVGFSGTPTYSEVLLPPGRWNERQVLDWCDHFFNGGTTADVPLSVLPFARWPEYVRQGMARGKTDLIFVTDGEIRVDPDTAQKFVGWKAAERVRTTCISIASAPGGLAGVCDAVHLVGKLDIDTPAVEAAFSI